MSRSEQIQSLYQKDFPPEEFSARRKKIFDAIGADACAVVQGAGPVDRSEPFRQTNEFYYLCGVETPQAFLVLDGRSRKTTLLLPPRDERQERSEGVMISADDGADLIKLAGVDAVLPTASLLDLLKGFGAIFTPHSPAEGSMMYRDELLHARTRIEADPWETRPSREQRLIELVRKNCPAASIQDLSPNLDRLRLIKSPREIALMRRAGELSALAVREAMRVTRPGLFEYHLGTLAQYIYRINGARGESYRPIAASGKANIWNAHYYRNNCELRDGELMLLDCAPDYRYYTSDIGRFWPVNGKYSSVQRELYGFMTRYHQELLQRIRPGVMPQQIIDETAAAMAPVIERTRFSKPSYERAAWEVLKFKGNLSHPVGMAVHDVGKYWDGELRPGLVFSVDPQMWVQDEQLYVRVEDTVVVTESGIENLTALAPLDLDEIEALVKQSASNQSLFANIIYKENN